MKIFITAFVALLLSGCGAIEPKKDGRTKRQARLLDAVQWNGPYIGGLLREGGRVVF